MCVVVWREGLVEREMDGERGRERERVGVEIMVSDGLSE